MPTSTVLRSQNMHLRSVKGKLFDFHALIEVKSCKAPQMHRKGIAKNVNGVYITFNLST